MKKKTKNKKRKPKDSMPLSNINLAAIEAGHRKFLSRHDNSLYKRETKRFFRTPFISR